MNFMQVDENLPQYFIVSYCPELLSSGVDSGGSLPAGLKAY
jgi:hypothetical protein